MQPSNTNYNCFMHFMQNHVFSGFEPEDLSQCKEVCTAWNSAIDSDKQLHKTLEIAAKIAKNIGLPVPLITKEFILNNAINCEFDLINRIKILARDFGTTTTFNEKWTLTFHNLETGDWLFNMVFKFEESVDENDLYHPGREFGMKKEIVLFSQKQITFIGHPCVGPVTSSTANDNFGFYTLPQGELSTTYMFKSLEYCDISKEARADIINADEIILTINNAEVELLKTLNS